VTVALIFEFNATNQKKINHKPSKFLWKNQRSSGKKKLTHFRGRFNFDDTLATFAEV
jgi:hypothetical protein